jgi:hypothetical protein
VRRHCGQLRSVAERHAQQPGRAQQQRRVAERQQVLAKVIELERKQQELQELERNLETLTGMLERSRADLAVSVTGIAGPGGGAADKPDGLQPFAAAARNGAVIHRERRFGDVGRAEVRRQSVLEALSILSELAQASPSKAQPRP